MATGGGAWGTALAAHAARMGHDTVLWAREPEVVTAINEQHENTAFLKVLCAKALLLNVSASQHKRVCSACCDAVK